MKFIKLILKVILLLLVINFETIITSQFPGVINLFVQLVFVTIYFIYFFPRIAKTEKRDKSTLFRILEALGLMFAFNLSHIIDSKIPSLFYLAVCSILSVILIFWLLPFLRAQETTAA